MDDDKVRWWTARTCHMVDDAREPRGIAISPLRLEHDTTLGQSARDLDSDTVEGEARLHEMLRAFLGIREREAEDLGATWLLPVMLVGMRQRLGRKEAREDQVTPDDLTSGASTMRVEPIKTGHADHLDAFVGHDISSDVKIALLTVVHEDGSATERCAILSVDRLPAGAVARALEVLLVESDERDTELLERCAELDFRPVAAVPRQHESHIAGRVEVTPHLCEEVAVLEQRRSRLTRRQPSVGHVACTRGQEGSSHRLEVSTIQLQDALEPHPSGDGASIIGEQGSRDDRDTGQASSDRPWIQRRSS
jgi:hypothetical protein